MTRDDWLQALNEANGAEPPDDGALTAREVSQLLGLKKDATRSRLLLLIEQGRATRTRKQIRGVDGRRSFVPAYRLVTPEG